MACIVDELLLQLPVLDTVWTGGLAPDLLQEAVQVLFQEVTKRLPIASICGRCADFLFFFLSG